MFDWLICVFANFVCGRCKSLTFGLILLRVKLEEHSILNHVPWTLTTRLKKVITVTVTKGMKELQSIFNRLSCTIITIMNISNNC